VRLLPPASRRLDRSPVAADIVQLIHNQLGHVIDLNWWLVLSPLFASFALYCLIFLLAVVVIIAAELDK
jgi:hypothetical protein